MKRVFKLEDLDCANCAAKMERAICKVDGVHSASVNFMGQRLTLEAEDARFEDVLKEVVKVSKRVEPDCKILIR